LPKSAAWGYLALELGLFLRLFLDPPLNNQLGAQGTFMATSLFWPGLRSILACHPRCFVGKCVIRMADSVLVDVAGRQRPATGKCQCAGLLGSISTTESSSISGSTSSTSAKDVCRRCAWSNGEQPNQAMHAALARPTGHRRPCR